VSGRTRGRETVVDMLRTLAVIFAVVLPLWFFGQASPSDTKRIRPVDPSDAYRAFAAVDHGPVPRATPPGWTCTVREFGEDRVLRVGYVKGEHYLEVAGARGTGFLQEETGRGRRTGTVDVQGTPWESWSNADGAQSLVLSRDGVTVLVGGTRETSSQQELVAFAASLG
jgi:hypothetical protein